MAGISSMLNIGNSALRASQASLQVTSNNIANVDTQGYSRQSVVLKDGQYVTTVPGQIGSGVVAQEVVRSHDAFIEAQYLGKLSARDRFQTLYNGLTSVQNLVNESNTSGTSKAMSKFFDDWGDLTTSPDSAAVRQTMIDDTETMLSLIRSTADSMTQLEDQANQSIAAGVDSVNNLANDIAELNRQINMTQIDGQSIPNGLYDQRDSKVRELASLIDVNVIDNGKGDITINTQSGQTVVDGVVPYEFKFEQGKTVRQLSSASMTAACDAQAYYEGSDTKEYTLKVVTGGAVDGGAAFQVSLDGGKSWLTNDDGTPTVYNADTAAGNGKVAVGDLDIWFGTTTDSKATVVDNLNVGDTFTLVPKKALYWYTTAGTAENITPQQYADGTDNTRRLTGGSLAGAFEFRDEELGGYQASLDAMAKSMVWEVNRIHSQGAGLTNFAAVQGTNSVADSSYSLVDPSSGLAYGNRLQSGASMVYAYDSTGVCTASNAVTFTPGDSLDDIVAQINAGFPGVLSASVVNNQLSIIGQNGNTFQFGSDSSGLWAALGVNTLLTGSTASDLAVNGVVGNDVNRVCAGHVGTNGLVAKGDNTTAKAMTALEDTKVGFFVTGNAATSQTLGDYYAALVGKVGSDTATASYQASYQTTLAAQLNEQQLAVSGVNLDEELTNLIKFQHSYQAAAKLISTADSLFETVLGLKN
ncbi:flagellar hook-associated protein FlgK [Desulfovibrio sp. TomC]|uniref:flagellar hook-associated protein FlgK n=1 Tax=Desulfovibrio sp. TomC TaxID=1562888 RepID=UPI0005742747|nr:flagellar hook-associated protein FlgK [Desulfovibrio sp. TomC]KHK02154.1 Flagellar hook-associated protein FlgK [Desulfovibrio sp. TomC]